MEVYSRPIFKILGFVVLGLLAIDTFIGFPQVKDVLAKPFQLHSQQAATVANQAGSSAWALVPGNAERMVIDLVSEAKMSLDIAAYEFTNKEIAEAVRAVENRGIKVRIVMDMNDSTGSTTQGLFRLTTMCRCVLQAHVTKLRTRN